MFQALGQEKDFLRIFALEHDPCNWFGSRIAQEQASSSDEGSGNFLYDRMDRRNLFEEGVFFSDRHVDENLRKALKIGSVR